MIHHNLSAIGCQACHFRYWNFLRRNNIFERRKRVL
ncbi:unnamed protein product, partial [Acanthoscelides obtectus]